MTTTETETTDVTAGELRWRITWRGRSWSESDLKGQHLSVLALLAGRDDFDQLEMSPTQGHQRLMMMISACVAVDATQGMDDPNEAAAVVAQSLSEVADAPIDEILGALTFEI